MNFRVVRAKASNRRVVGLAVGTLTVALYAAMVIGAVGDTTADRVLGQFDFSHNAANLIDGNGLANAAFRGDRRERVAESAIRSRHLQQPGLGLQRCNHLSPTAVRPTW